jgi:rare lipoprotein A
MKTFLIAALAVISFGLLGTQQASAAWQDEIFGNATNRPRAERPARAERSTTTAPSQRAARAARADTTADRPQRAARSNSNSDSGGSSLGGGLASYYWQPQRVASGGWFNPNAMTAAHKTLPFGTRVRVTNERNGQSVDVTINDRGPYIAGRVIDLSSAAAGVINMKGSGVVPVRMTVLGR